MNKIEFQMAKTLQEAIGVEVEVTIRGTLNEKVEFTISSNQFDAIKAAGFMVNKGLAELTGAVSYIEDPDMAYYFLTA